MNFKLNYSRLIQLENGLRALLISDPCKSDRGVNSSPKDATDYQPPRKHHRLQKVQASLMSSEFPTDTLSSDEGTPVLASGDTAAAGQSAGETESGSSSDECSSTGVTSDDESGDELGSSGNEEAKSFSSGDEDESHKRGSLQPKMNHHHRGKLFRRARKPRASESTAEKLVRSGSQF